MCVLEFRINTKFWIVSVILDVICESWLIITGQRFLSFTQFNNGALKNINIEKRLLCEEADWQWNVSNSLLPNYYNDISSSW